MNDQKNIEINLVELVSIATDVLYRALITPPKLKVKPLFKEIKAGKSISLGTLSLGKTVDLTLKLTLDHSEFCGPGFNYDVFKSALDALIKSVTSYIRSKKSLNIMTDDKGTALVHVPGIVQVENVVNVLVMAFETAQENQITLQLMFIDPEQYDALKR